MSKLNRLKMSEHSRTDPVFRRYRIPKNFLTLIVEV